MATHAGMTTSEFEDVRLDRDCPRSAVQAPLHRAVYQPMLELLAYLRANGFKTFIVSGGGIEFMRPWTEKVYGIPPEQVVGSSIKTGSRCATAGRPCSVCPRSTSSTTRPASRSASTSISAAVRLPRSATPTAISRCCSGRR